MSRWMEDGLVKTLWLILWLSSMCLDGLWASLTVHIWPLQNYGHIITSRHETDIHHKMQKKKFNFWSLKRLEAAFLTPRNQYNISQTSYVIWKTVKFYQNDKKLLPITDISKIILHWKGNYWQTLYISVSFSDTSGRNKICDFLRKNFGIPQIHQKLMSTHA